MYKNNLTPKIIIFFILLLTVVIQVNMNFAQEIALMKKEKTLNIKLPEPDAKGKISLEEALQKRRSKRNYLPDNLSMKEISQLLWAAQGITQSSHNFRTAPSAGALYPLELYIVISDGVYHYNPHLHTLETLSTEDIRGSLSQAALGQRVIKDAPLSILITVVYERVTSKYGQRGNRYVDMEVGHSAQNIHLQAIALGLSSVPVGAFNDETVSKLLNLPPEHQPRYIIPVGHSK